MADRPPRREEMAGLVLAGGEGRRMGGVDKGLQIFNGEPLARHVAERLMPQVATLAISANRHLAEYRAWGWPVIEDSPGQQGRGPLAGMLAGLAWLATGPCTWLACAPCDVPNLPAHLVPRLAVAATGVQVVWAAAPDDAFGDGQPRRHPTCCLLHRSLLAPLSAYLDAGGRRIDAWMRSLPHAEVVFEDGQAFANLNTLDALSAAQPGIRR